MNVAFHTLVGLGTAAVLSSRLKAPDSSRVFVPSDLPILAVGFVAGVLMHGLLDYAPHAYPIKSAVDLVFSLAAFFTALLLAEERHWLLLGGCFLGSIFPDLVDLGPAIVNKRAGLSLPTVKVFPWHWREYSGSVYDGSRSLESAVYHLVVTGVSLALLWSYRERSFPRRASKRRGPSVKS